MRPGRLDRKVEFGLPDLEVQFFHAQDVQLFKHSFIATPTHLLVCFVSR